LLLLFKKSIIIGCTNLSEVDGLKSEQVNDAENDLEDNISIYKIKTNKKEFFFINLFFYRYIIIMNK
jgi:hypothetical protein